MDAERQKRIAALLNGRPSKREIDWEFIEREYRAGRMSIHEIARQAGVSRPLIHARVNKEGWTRDLSGKIRSEVAARLTPALTPETERSAIELAAARSVEVIREHRAAIGHGQRLVLKLFQELDEAASEVVAIEEEIDEETRGDRNFERKKMMLRAVALPTRAATLGSLSGALRTFVGLERQAFNLAAESDVPSRPTEAIEDTATLKQAAERYSIDLEA